MRKSPRKRTRDYPQSERARERRRKRKLNRKPLPEGTEPVLVPAKDGKTRNIAGLAAPWPKGVSGNPAGRKPGLTITDHYRLELDEVCPETGRSWGEEIARNVVRGAAKGQVTAAAEIEDRLKGRPKVYVENKLPPEGRPVLNVCFVDKFDIAMKTEISRSEPLQIEGESNNEEQ